MDHPIAHPLNALVPRVLDLACQIQQIAAPTFHEAPRAAFVREQFAALGLADVEVDDLGNVFARRPGRDPALRPLLITAHTDTVFPPGTPLTLERTPQRISGPGIGDNSLGVAGLFGLLWALDAPSSSTAPSSATAPWSSTAPSSTTALPGDLLLVANVGEEGLGDLRGMRRVMDRLGERVRATLVLEGMALGHIYHGAIGVRRYRITARTAGGHSWLHFGRPSAIHTLVRIGTQITDLVMPLEPKTTFNIGTIGGGTSVNTIAREASFDLDLRSEAPALLDALAARVTGLATAHTTAEVEVEATVIGDRPAGSLPREHPLARLAARSYAAAGLGQCSFESGSTDANIPLSRGLPCVCVGLARGANSHRPDEYIDTQDIDRALEAVVRLVRGAYEIE